MGWGKKELPKYPPLGFEIGEFIRDKVKMNPGQTEVENTFYYEGGKISRNYYYSAKTRNFETDGSVYTEMSEEDIKGELTRLMDEEDIAKAEKENEGKKEEV